MNLSRLQLTVGVFIFITLLNWTFFTGREGQAFADALAQWHVAEQQLIDGQQKANHLALLRHDVERARARHPQLETKLPHAPALAPLEQALRTLASAAMLRSLVITLPDETKPAPPAAAWWVQRVPAEAPITSWPFTLQATGTGRQLGFFLDALGRHGRALAVTRVALGNPRAREGRTVVDATLELVAFESKVEAALPAPVPLTEPPRLSPLEALFADLPTPRALPPPTPETMVEPPEGPHDTPPFLFDAAKVRDPFHPWGTTLVAGNPAPLPAGACANARPARLQGLEGVDPLDLYDLDQLHLVAARPDGVARCALLRDPTGTCHERRLDEPVGTGRTLDLVEPTGITIRETLTEPGGTRLFPTTLRMKVAPGGRAPASFCTRD